MARVKTGNVTVMTQEDWQAEICKIAEAALEEQGYSFDDIIPESLRVEEDPDDSCVFHIFFDVYPECEE